MLNVGMLAFLLSQATPATWGPPFAPKPTPDVRKPAEFEAHGEQVFVFPVVWLKAINAAVTDFRRTHKNFECYRIIMVKQAGWLEINFSSPMVTSQSPESDLINIGPELKCGIGERYLVRLNGEIIRRISSR